MSVRSSGRLCRSSNHCFAGNIHIIGEGSPLVSTGKRGQSSADAEVSGASRSSPRKKRLYEANEKVYILKAYVKWREAGSSHWNLPMKNLKKKYPKKGPNYPKSPYDKMLSIGTTAGDQPRLARKCGTRWWISSGSTEQTKRRRRATYFAWGS